MELDEKVERLSHFDPTPIKRGPALGRGGKKGVSFSFRSNKDREAEVIGCICLTVAMHGARELATELHTEAAKQTANSGRGLKAWARCHLLLNAWKNFLLTATSLSTS